MYSRGPSQQKPFKFLGENGAWAYPGTAQIFWVPPIISGTGNATNFNFCSQILSIDRNKSPLQISGKVAGCLVRTLKSFQGTYILGASRGLLCDSSAVLWVIVIVVILCNSEKWTSKTTSDWNGWSLENHGGNQKKQTGEYSHSTKAGLDSTW